ncbi:MAG: M48 family metallopeptidase [Actinobacteria bacterium]|nr:M48 family metallopeptidase [Cyanobacteriota bacterium]MCL6086936.1 M48 family metallopeptidase [Actinomycetota bacterium]
MKLTTKCGDRIIEFEVKYKNRKTLAIQIEPLEKISVFSPRGLSEETIIEKVKSKSRWIIKKLLDFQETGYNHFNKNFADGEMFMYLGRDYSLHIQLNKNFKRPEVMLNDGKLSIITPSKEKLVLKKALGKWYRKEAEKIILKRIELIKPKFNNIELGQIKIKEQKKRWGSCTFKGNLLFNWRIVMAPYCVIDYIIVHELSHLVHKNHSKKFWDMVESILPDYKERKKWLRNYGIRMDL